MSEKELKDEVENIEKEDCNEDEVVEVDELTLLTEKIEKLETEKLELENKYFMAYADAQNISKRAKIDAENMLLNKISKLAEDILPALDNFERALSVNVEDESIANFLKGFEMIHQQLTTALSNEGIVAIDSLGKEFDPNFHQSLGVVNDENYASNIIVEEMQKGYMFRNKVIRPALVKINE